MPYKFREDIAMADVAVEVRNKDLEALFKEAAEAMADVMINRKTLKAKKTRKIKLKNNDLEMLLFKWLEEIIFVKDAKNFLGKEFKVKIRELKSGGFGLNGEIIGEEADQKRHEMRTDVKAVTMHMFSLKKEGNYWKALIVLDT